jgi:NAD(P)H dehydrogenase (quinone)
MPTKVYVVFYSMYGHIYKMAEAIAAGAREVPDTQVTLYQVPPCVRIHVASSDLFQKSRGRSKAMQ